jgi:hypothetical protein
MTKPRSRQSHLWSGLAGGVIAALLLTIVPVGAAQGDPVRAGQLTKSGGHVTRLKGKGNPTLRLINKNNNPALEIRVESDTAPMQINSSVLVDNLNADRLDNRHANTMIRVAGDYSSNLPDGTILDQDVLAATITAPTAGFLVMTGSSDSWTANTSTDTFECSFEVNNSTVTGSVRQTRPSETSTYSLADQDDCTTHGFATVGAGTYTVAYNISSANDADLRFDEGSMFVIYIPFGATGDVGA